ncbi:MAG: hypothetical protein FD127_4100, partial [Acidimicrobiaceae bacterium]
TADYVEGVSSVYTPTLVFGGTGGAHFSVTSTNRLLSDTRFLFAVTVDTALTAQAGDAYTASVDLARDYSLNAQAAPATFGGTVDNVSPLPPTVAFAGGSPNVKAGLVQFSLSFTEPLTSSVTPAPQIGGTGASFFSPITFLSRDGASQVFTYSTNVTGTTPLPGSSYTLTVPKATVVDRAVNTQLAPDKTVDGIVDTVNPDVALTYSKEQTAVSSGALTITASFNEDITNSIPLIAIDRPGTGGDIAATSMSPVAGNLRLWTYSYLVAVRSGSAIQDGPTTATVTASRDLSSNENRPATNNVFIVDTLPLAVALSYGGELGYIVTSTPVAIVGVGRLSITATFSEDVRNSTPVLRIDRSSTGNDLSSTAMSASSSPRVWTASWDVTRQNGTTVLDGRAAMFVTSATDLAGNLNQAPTNSTVDVDTTAPPLTLTVHQNDPGTTDTVTGTTESTATVRVFSTHRTDGSPTGLLSTVPNAGPYGVNIGDNGNGL